MTKKKPMLILIATGTAGGKGTFISKIKKNQLLSDTKVCQIGTDSYVTIRIKEESKVGEIVYGFEGTGFGSTGSGSSGLSNHQKKELNENLQVRIKIEHDWTRPESVNVKALKQKIEEELSEQTTNKVIIVEGMHALQFSDIRELADLKIWIHNDDDLRLVRKIARSPYCKKMAGETPDDPRNFGGTFNPLPYSLKAWVDGIKTGEKLNISPTRKYADLVIFSNDWDEFNRGVETIASLVSLYFENRKEFKKKAINEKKQRIKSEISKLKEQLQEKETELSRLVTDEKQVVIHQSPK